MREKGGRVAMGCIGPYSVPATLGERPDQYEMCEFVRCVAWPSVARRGAAWPTKASSGREAGQPCRQATQAMLWHQENNDEKDNTDKHIVYRHKKMKGIAFWLGPPDYILDSCLVSI